MSYLKSTVILYLVINYTLLHIGTLKSKLNERIEEEHCSSPAPVATYRARFPQQSATSAVQEWLVRVLTAICIKVLNGGFRPIQNFNEEN